MEYEIVRAINEAIIHCKEWGSANIKIEKEGRMTITIGADWDEWECEENWDAITISIWEDNRLKFVYQVEETKVRNDL